MKRVSSPASNRLYLGIEGGGTHTVALLADDNVLVQRAEFGAANIRLLTDAALLALFQEIAAVFPRPYALGIGLAGARASEDQQRIRHAAGLVWPGVPCHVTHDLETALAADGALPGANRPVGGRSVSAKVLVLSGTGSCCYGINVRGGSAKFGGWGHILGDKGSAYEIGLRALKAVVYHFDRDGRWPALGSRLLRVLQRNEPNDLITWVQGASKAEIAALAQEVFAAWEECDWIATDILEAAAESLARDGAACARRLSVRRGHVNFVLAGGVLLRQSRFARRVARELKQLWPGCSVAPLGRESAWGAVELAKALAPMPGVEYRKSGGGHHSLSLPSSPSPVPATAIPRSTGLSPTEQRNPRSLKLDRMSVAAAARLMLDEDAGIPTALRQQLPALTRAVNWVSTAFKRGGRLFYAGAGTSGRLGILDASECPPTFRTPPEWVQGIIAGGEQAVFQAVEGAEDDYAAGGKAILYRGVNQDDVVVGIAASGRTPFVWGVLSEARRVGARTVLVAFNPNLEFAPGMRPDLVINPDLGPEVLTGSTRLKAGTATKLLLNILTTLAMVRAGKVVSNLMVDLNPSNTKLRDRAVRIIRELSGVDADAARMALEKNGWNVKQAWQSLRGRKPKA